MDRIFSMSNTGQYFNDILLQHIRDGNEAAVSSILQGTNPSQLADSSGATLLHVAARYGNAWLAHYIIGLGAIVDAQNHAQETPLMFAVRNDHLEVVKILLDANADIYLPDRVGQCALSRAFQNGDTNGNNIREEFQKYITCESLNSSIHVNTKLFHLNCPLAEFMVLKNSNITRILLEKGSVVDARDRILGETALHTAVENLHYENVKLLLEYGADVNMKDSDGYTPLNYLKNYEDPNEALAVLNILLTSGATLIDYFDRKLFADAVLSGGNREIIRCLLKYGIDLHFIDETGRTPLHYLVQNQNPDIFKELRRLHFNVNILPSNFRYTLLHHAASCGNASFINYLLDRGADIDADGYKGFTPLCIIIFCGGYEKRLDDYVKCMEILLAKGANPRLLVEKNYKEFQTILLKPISDNFTKIMKPIFAHVCALEASNQDIGEAMRTISSIPQFKTIVDLKKIELEEIKQINLGKSVTLLDFLVANKDVVSWYARCRSFSTNLFNTVYLSNLDPYYKYKLQENFKIFVALTDVRNAAAFLINTIFLIHSGISVNNVAEKIASYLEDREIQKFVYEIENMVS